MATDVEIVRLKTSDQPVLRRETAEGDGVTDVYNLAMGDLLASPAPKVTKNGTLQTTPAQYSIDLVNGVIDFVTAPVPNDELVFEYFSVVYTDAEVQIFLDEAGGNTDYAACRNLWAWSASASKLARKESLAGGGGIGSVTLDTAVTAIQLREAAKGYLDLYKATAEAGLIDSDLYGPADGLTETVWTEQMLDRSVEQELFRNS